MFVKHNLHTFTVQADFRDYSTRNCNELCITSYRTKRFEKFPFCRGKILYNKLPVTVKNVSDNSLFSR